MIIRHAVVSQGLVCNVGSVTCCFTKDSFRGSETVSCHVFSSIKCSGHEHISFSILGIHVYLCHQHITFKFSNSLESPLPAPPQHSRKLKIRAAGNAKADIHSFLCSLCFLAPGRDGCTAVGSPLPAGTRTRHGPVARPPQGPLSANWKATRVQTANNRETVFFHTGDQHLHDSARASAPESNFHKFFLQRLITYCRGTGCTAWGQDVLTLPL